MKKKSKKERQEELTKMLEQDPFYTDEELSNFFNVSIQTIRLDRLTLSIPELRERVKNLAEKNVSKVKTLVGKDMVGELIDIQLGRYGISMLNIDIEMTYEKTGILKGHYLYGQAESLAMSVIDAPVVFVGVANVKTIRPIKREDRLIAKAEIARVRDKKHYVHVKIYNKDQEQVFRGKFIFDEIS